MSVPFYGGLDLEKTLESRAMSGSIKSDRTKNFSTFLDSAGQPRQAQPVATKKIFNPRKNAKQPASLSSRPTEGHKIDKDVDIDFQLGAMSRIKFMPLQAGYRRGDLGSKLDYFLRANLLEQPNAMMKSSLDFDNGRDNYFRLFKRMGKSLTPEQLKENERFSA